MSRSSFNPCHMRQPERLCRFCGDDVCHLEDHPGLCCDHFDLSCGMPIDLLNKERAKRGQQPLRPLPPEEQVVKGKQDDTGRDGFVRLYESEIKPHPSDPTNPHHYSRLDPQPIDVIAAWGLDYDRGCAVKYIARAGVKDPSKEVEDLEKAITYLQHRIKVVRERKRQP